MRKQTICEQIIRGLFFVMIISVLIIYYHRMFTDTLYTDNLPTVEQI